MSLSGATRALGSSIIDRSYLEPGWAAPGGDYLFTGSRARRKGCAAPAAPRKCVLLGAQRKAGEGSIVATRPSAPSADKLWCTNPLRWTLRYGLAVSWSR